jgi:rare lipoprotein A
VLGKEYVPNTAVKPYKARGIASWYGKKFHGQKTSIGEPYDMFAMTAAHTTLALPSYARVTNVQTGKSVVVRVTDRGPFHADRVIDLSYTAAYKLGLINGGSGQVEVEAIIPGEATGTTYAQTTRRRARLRPRRTISSNWPVAWRSRNDRYRLPPWRA